MCEDTPLDLIKKNQNHTGTYEGKHKSRQTQQKIYIYSNQSLCLLQTKVTFNEINLSSAI